LSAGGKRRPEERGLEAAETGGREGRDICRGFVARELREDVPMGEIGGAFHSSFEEER